VAGGGNASPISLAYRLMGGMPKPLVRRAFQLTSFNKLVTKPFVQLAKLDDTDFLAQLEAVDRFTSNMLAYPGRSFGQLYHRMIRHNEIATGTVHLEGRELRLADISVPVLSFGGANDVIAPVGCVEPVVRLLTGSPETRFEVVPGGHLGMLTGRAARGTTWRILDEWLDQHAKAPSRDRRTTENATVTPHPRRRAVVDDHGDPVIGSNPKRRFSSASSRNLSPAKRQGRSAG
jgi:polyhydroxyalkanoate synthase